MNILERKIIGFRQTVRQFLTSKTNWTALVAIGAAVAGYHTHQIGAQEAVNAIGTALGAMFIKDAVS